MYDLFRLGKIIASFFAIFAISFFALPAVSRRPTSISCSLVEHLGYPWLGLRSQSSTEATSEAFLSADSSGRHVDSSSLACLCQCAGLVVRRHVEYSSARGGPNSFLPHIQNLSRQQSDVQRYVVFIRSPTPHAVVCPLQNERRRNYDTCVYRLVSARAARRETAKRQRHRICCNRPFSASLAVPRRRRRIPQVEIGCVDLPASCRFRLLPDVEQRSRR